MARFSLRDGATATVTRGALHTDIHLVAADGRTISSLTLPHHAADVILSQIRRQHV